MGGTYLRSFAKRWVAPICARCLDQMGRGKVGGTLLEDNGFEELGEAGCYGWSSQCLAETCRTVTCEGRRGRNVEPSRCSMTDAAFRMETQWSMTCHSPLPFNDDTEKTQHHPWPDHATRTGRRSRALRPSGQTIFGTIAALWLGQRGRSKSSAESPWDRQQRSFERCRRPESRPPPLRHPVARQRFSCPWGWN